MACRGESPPSTPAFLTVHELYRALIGAREHARAAVVDYPEFARWYDVQ